MQDGTECSLAVLSQRKEFLGKAAIRESSNYLTGGIWVSTCRGQKGRQVAEERLLPPAAVRTPRPGTREMAGIAGEFACMSPTGVVSARLPTQASRRYYGPASPARRRGSRGHRRRNKTDGHGFMRDTEQGEVAGAHGTRSQSLLGRSDKDRVTRMEQAGRDAAACLVAADYGNRAVCPCPTGAPSPRSGSLPGLVERWKKREIKTAPATPDGTGKCLSEDVGTRLGAIGTGEVAPRTEGAPSLGPEKVVVPSELVSVPDSVEARLAGSRVQMSLEIKTKDWSEMEEVGLGCFPDLAVAFAWRRCTGPSTGRDHRRLPTIQLVSQDAEDIPRDCWPTSWEGLVQHVERGGYFRTVGAMRGGMDLAVAQQQLDLVDFSRHLDWDDIDRCLARVRAGDVIGPEEMRYNMNLAQWLSACTALQQWDSLAAFLASQPQEVREGLIISPARLAALSVIVARPRPEPTAPPQWLLSASFAELRFHHLSPKDFVPDCQRANDLRGQIHDGIVKRLLSLAPEMKQHPHYRLQNLRTDLRVELNPKDLHEACLFSISAVLPVGPWISDFYKGVKSLGGRSFCTIAPTDLHVETELSNTDQQVLRAIRSALGVDNALFRQVLNETLSADLRCEVRSRDDTVHFTSTGGRGGKRTMEHVSPDSSESRLLITLDATSLIVARRATTALPLRLGPVTVSITLMQCPQQALRNALQPREPAAIRLRQPGTVIDCPVVLIGPLPKGSIPARTVTSGVRMAELRSHINDVFRTELRTTDARFVGRYDKDRSPMFLYMEFGSAADAHAFGLTGDQGVPPEFGRLMASLWGDKAFQMPVWSCNLLAECLAVADEKMLKALMSHGQAHPCPLIPLALPPPPPPAHEAGLVVDGTGSAASGPDNPGNVGH